MKPPETAYDFSIRVTAVVPGSPKPVQLSARVAYLIRNTLEREGFTIPENALPSNIGVEVTDMRYDDGEDE